MDRGEPPDDPGAAAIQEVAGLRGAASPLTSGSVADRDTPTSGDVPPEQALPTPAESWQRNIEILDLVTQIREARRRRLEEQGPDRPRR